MADATEDLHAPNTFDTDLQSSPQSDSEDDDLPPDFLNLMRTTKDKKGKVGAPPKRGTKDFEENRTQLQSRTLEASRQAMWDTLGVVRVHHPTTFKKGKRKVKKPTKAVRSEEIYPEINIHPQTKPAAVDYEDEVDEGEEEVIFVSGSSGTPVGVYNPATRQTHISAKHRRGKIFDTIGQDLRGGGVSLYPEEALWALEGSKLDVRYPSSYFDDSSKEAGEGRDADSELENEDDDDSGIPLSLQGAYAAYIGCDSQRNGKLTQEKYLVYAALRRLGYIVLRAPEWSGYTLPLPPEPYTPWSISRRETCKGGGPTTPKRQSTTQQTQSLFQRLHCLLFGSTHTYAAETPQSRLTRQARGALIQPGLYRSHAEIYRLLSLIPSHDPTAPPTPACPRIVVSHYRNISDSNKVTLGGTSPPNGDATQKVGGTAVRENAIMDEEENPYSTHWNVYKPGGSKDAANSFKKSRPGEPDFRVCVVPARETSLPALSQMEALFGEQRVVPPPSTVRRSTVRGQEAGASSATDHEKDGQNPSRPEGIGAVYNRLKHGYKNVILAVVDEGIVSFVRLADAGFSRERLYERAEQEGGGRGGKGGGRGRGGQRRGGRGMH